MNIVDCVGALAAALAMLWGLLVVFSPKPRPRLPSECIFLSAKHPNDSDAQPLPSIHDDATQTLSLSVVVPAFDEAKRLPAMLEEALDHLEDRKKALEDGSYEILVVDDGSRDNTAQVAIHIAQKFQGKGGENIRVVKLAFNRGKGGAVTHASSNCLPQPLTGSPCNIQGMLFTRGKMVLFADADAASRFSDLALLEKTMAEIQSGNGHGFVLGSRAWMVDTEAVVKRSAVRNLLMRSFHLYLQILGISSVQDTQCGFKLMTRASARLVFPLMHVEGWIFDIELIILALLAHIPVGEIAITWKEVEGSKMQLAKDSIVMALDLLVIRANYALGWWQKPSDSRITQK